MSEKDQMRRRGEAGRPDIPGYGIHPDGEGVLPWSFVDKRMSSARNYWVSTTRPDGRPHAAPVWGVWLDGAFYFGTGSASRKARNLAKSPNLVVHLESGDEVVIFEGGAEEVADPASLDAAFCAKRWIAWPERRGQPARSVLDGHPPWLGSSKEAPSVSSRF